MIKSLFFTLLISIVSVQVIGQNIKFASFQQYCTCNSELFSDIKSDSILNVSIIREDVLSVDIVSQSTCFTTHLGGIKYEHNSLQLIFLHESVEPPPGFTIIGYKPSEIIEVADCATNFLFGFSIFGIEKIPESIELNGTKLKVPDIR